MFSYVKAVEGEHVEGFTYEFFVEPDLCYGVEAFEDEVDSVGFKYVPWRGECFFIDPWLLADPLEVFGICVQVDGINSACVDEGGKD